METKTAAVRVPAKVPAKRFPWKSFCTFFWISFIAKTIVAWLGIMESTLTTFGELESRPPDPVILPIPKSGDKNNPYFVNMTSSSQSVLRSIRSAINTKAPPYDKHHRGYHLVKTNYPWSVVLPDMSVNNVSNSSEITTTLLQKTSHQARNQHCDIVATNGGPFDKGGIWNSGPTVLRGKLIRTKPSPEDSQFVGFGISLMETSGDRNRNWVLGQYGQLVRSSSKARLWNFVTGFGWLVYEGKPRVTTSHHSSRKKHPEPTGAIRAPRSAVGLDKDLNLMLLVVDGCQRCLTRKGLTLEELADLLVDLGALYAINMDGGGSSTMVMTSSSYNFAATHRRSAHHDYSVINRPTCLDLPFPLCERAVSTVLCVSTNGTE